MNFRRQPFQFTSIDPVKRHAELQKRFGLPSDEMYVDFANPGVMGAMDKESLMNGSLRLQHRVPVFPEDVNSVKQSGVQNNVDNGHQSRVRVVPIQVEGLNDASRRHRTFSGPGLVHSSVREKSPERRIKPQLVNNPTKIADHPKVCNIPIKIESQNTKAKNKESKCKETIIPTVIEQKQVPKEPSDSCAMSKTPEQSASESFKQIENVLNKLKGYKAEVEKFTGTNKDKQYRYLDEMLTRCMLDLDNVDTLGMDNVRQSRKNAVKEVQACIDLLETKVSFPSTVDEATESATIAEMVQLNEPEIAMVVDTEGKECEELENTDVVVEKDNLIEDVVASSEPAQPVVDKEVKEHDELENDVVMEKDNLTEVVASSEPAQSSDVEMEDKSSEDQSSKVVVEELEELGSENLTDVNTSVDMIEDILSDNKSLEVIKEETEDVDGSPKDRITIEEVEASTKGEISECIVEEMCSEGEKSPIHERIVPSEINTELVITEQDSSETLELSDNTSNEQISTISSSKSDLCNTVDTGVDKVQISVIETVNKS